MGLSVDWKRAGEIFPILLHALERRKYPYRWAFPPHAPAKLPRTMPRGSIEHANFLFCSCYYMRGRIRSDTAIQNLASVYLRHPKIFDPAWIAKRNPKYAVREVRRALRENGLGRNCKENSRFWVLNFRKLYEHWSGDVRKLLRGARSYEDICARIIRTKKGADGPHGFFGFREKMTSMLIYFLVDSDLFDPVDFPLPIDFHLMRVFVANEIIVPDEGVTDGSSIGNFALQRKARQLTLEYCVKHGVNPLRLCDALWHLSREGCARNLGNKSSKGRYTSRTTPIDPYVVTWNHRDIKAFDSGCGRCPIRGWCQWNIPEAVYYNRGRITVRGSRPEPPEEMRDQHELSFIAAQ
ncbi:MAG: hypothetical protein AMXMBFR44_3940 [Candidatus Campbellbacteria bacterium]